MKQLKLNNGKLGTNIKLLQDIGLRKIRKSSLQGLNSLLILLLFVVSLTTFVSSCNVPQQSSSQATSLSFLHVASVGESYAIENADNQIVTLNGVNLGGMEDQAYTGSNGVNPNYPVSSDAYKGKCPANKNNSADPPVCEVSAGIPVAEQSASDQSENDFAQIKKDGFNLARLTINWSEVEPSPGKYSVEFLKRLEQVVSWAAEFGIYVIIDFHQDGYSRFIEDAVNLSRTNLPTGCNRTNGQDGAPLWAVMVDSQPDCAIAGQSSLDLATASAWMNFWNNTTYAGNQGESPGAGLQDHYVGALSFVARQFKNNPDVAGYEIMNEPFPGLPGPIPLADPRVFALKALYPFYARVIEAITGIRDGKPTCNRNKPSGYIADYSGHDFRYSNGQIINPGEVDYCSYPDLGVETKQLIFFEPVVLRDDTDFSLQEPPNSQILQFTTYPNLVFAPHIYSHVFTLDAAFNHAAPTSPVADLSGYQTALGNINVPSQGIYPPSYFFGDATALFEANEMHAAILPTEYGAPPSETGSALSGIKQAENYYAFGSVFWVFKENCQGNSYCNSSWGLYDAPHSYMPGKYYQNGPLRQDRLRVVDQPRLGSAYYSSLKEINFGSNFGIYMSVSSLQGHDLANLFVPDWLSSAQVKFLGGCKIVSEKKELGGKIEEFSEMPNSFCAIEILSSNSESQPILNALMALGPTITPEISDNSAFYVLRSYANSLLTSPVKSAKESGQLILALINYLSGGIY